MTQARGSTDEFAQELYENVARVVKAHAGDSATVDLRHDTETPFPSYIIEVVPASENSAPVKVQFDARGESTDVVLGQETRFELFSGSRSRDIRRSTLQAEVEALIEAAVAGRFRESVWKRRGKVVKSRGVVEIDSREIISTTSTLGSPLFGSTRRTDLAYAPYTRT